MAEQISLALEPRDILGKKVRHLRRSGITPVHLYGRGIAPQHLQTPTSPLLKILAQTGMHTPVSITVEGEPKEHLAFVREVQWDPRGGELLHVDFLGVDITQRISAEVPLILKGRSPGAEKVQGTVAQQLYYLEVEALPLDIPSEIEVDISALTEPDSVLRAREIPLSPNVTLLTDPDETVARVQVAKEEVAEAAPKAEAAEAETVDETKGEAEG